MNWATSRQEHFRQYRCAGRTERGPHLADTLLKLRPDVLVGARR